MLHIIKHSEFESTHTTTQHLLNKWNFWTQRYGKNDRQFAHTSELQKEWSKICFQTKKFVFSQKHSCTCDM